MRYTCLHIGSCSYRFASFPPDLLPAPPPELQRVLVGQFHPGRVAVQRLWHLVRHDLLQLDGDALLQLGQHQVRGIMTLQSHYDLTEP